MKTLNEKILMINRFKHQGKKARDYFEGWYVRLYNNTGDLNLACIFAYTKYHNDPHAFIQVYNGHLGKNTYYRFDINDFEYKDDAVRIQNNLLAVDHLIVATEDTNIDVALTRLAPLDVKSAMGYLSKLPLECYQEVIFMDGVAEGVINGAPFTGKTYMEKTYGKRFPKKWFWLQANSFDQAMNFTLAGGHVPTLFFKPFGFFAIIQFDQKEWVFGTYNRAKCRVRKTENYQFFTLTKGQRKVVIQAKVNKPVCLVGPTDKGLMNLDVFEDLYAAFKIEVFENKELIFETHSNLGGFEWMFS